MHRYMILLFVISVFWVYGCSAETQDDLGLRPAKGNAALDRSVIVLRPDMSIADVKRRLGEPSSEREFDDEDPKVQMLFYGRWQLLFEEGRLDRRIKYVYERPIPPSHVVDQREKALSRKVLSLKLGSSKRMVRAKFGLPDTYEIWQNTPVKEETLTYELWELTFVDGGLRIRSKR